MGLLAQEIRELRMLIKQYEQGKVSDQHVVTKMKMYKEVRERVKLIMQAYLACKPKTISSKLHSLNIINQGESIVSEDDLEISAVKCPDQDDKIITRESCLTYSGDTKNFETCKTCDNFKITREMLLPKRT